MVMRSRAQVWITQVRPKAKAVKNACFVCTSTSLAHVEVAESYSTESFLMAVRRFMALHGAPKRFQSDQGTQLVAASKQLATWDWTAVHEQAERVGAEWHIVPTGGQHYNGQAERLI